MNSYGYLQNLLETIFEIPKEKISKDATLESLDLDSLSVAEILFSASDEFNVDLSDIDLNVKTLGGLAHEINKKL